MGEFENPGLRPAQPVAALDRLRDGGHRTRIGACVGFGQAEAADIFAGGKLLEVFPPLLVVPVGVDRKHDERGLHAHQASIAGIDALDLAGDEAIGDIRCARAAIFRRKGQPKQAKLAHLVENGAIRLFVSVRLDDPGTQPVFREGMRCFLDQTLFVAELLVQQKGVGPVEGRRFCLGCLVHPMTPDGECALPFSRGCGNHPATRVSASRFDPDLWI